MANIYELTEQIKALQAAYENGEVPEDAFNDTLEALNMEREEAIENICKWRADVLADIAGYKAEINRLSERKQHAEKLVERLQNYMYSALQAAGQRKIKAGTFTVSIAKSTPAVHITDEKAIPAEYFKQPAPVLDKTKLKEALRTGQQVPGAELVQGEHLNIR